MAIYVYPKRKEIVKFSSEPIEHKAYDYETSRIQILPKKLSEDIIIEPDETSITFNKTSTPKL